MWISLSVERPEGMLAPVSQHSVKRTLEPKKKKVVALPREGVSSETAFFFSNIDVLKGTRE